MNIPKLFYTVTRRLSNIERFNNTPRINRESVAEHSYFVAFYCMILSRFVKNIDREKVFKLALVHDIEETISGDLPHDIKLKYPEFNDTLEKMNMSIVKEIFDNNEEFVEVWSESRTTKTKESQLLKLADLLSVLLYARDEFLTGNKFMGQIYTLQIERIVSFISEFPEFEFIKNLGFLDENCGI